MVSRSGRPPALCYGQSGTKLARNRRPIDRRRQRGSVRAVALCSHGVPSSIMPMASWAYGCCSSSGAVWPPRPDPVSRPLLRDRYSLIPRRKVQTRSRPQLRNGQPGLPSRRQLMESYGAAARMAVAPERGLQRWKVRRHLFQQHHLLAAFPGAVLPSHLPRPLPTVWHGFCGESYRCLSLFSQWLQSKKEIADSR